MDLATSYDLQANASVPKPVEPEDFIEIMTSLSEYWLNIVHLPPTDD